MADRSIKQSVSLNITPNEAFEYLTDQKKLTKWFPNEATAEAKVGGAYTFRFLKKDGSLDHERAGTFRALEPGRAVEFDWSFGAGPTEVRFEIAENGSGTTVELQHSGFGTGTQWDEPFSMHDAGWRFFLDNLKSVVEKNQDNRAQMFG